MKHALNLSQYHFVQRHGDLTAFGTWYGTEQQRPALVLVRTNAVISHERVTPVVIPMDNLWIWSEEVGDPAHCAQACYRFAPSLGLDPYNSVSMMRIASIVRDHIGDVMSMPTEPTGEFRVVADALMTDADGKETHKEIRERA